MQLCAEIIFATAHQLVTARCNYWKHWNGSHLQLHYVVCAIVAAQCSFFLHTDLTSETESWQFSYTQLAFYVIIYEISIVWRSRNMYNRMCTCQALSRSFMRLIRISDEPKRQRTAQPILGLAHLCMIDSMAPHNVPCSSTHISHIIMCWNSAEWVVSVVSHLQLGKKCGKTCSDRQQLLPPKHYCFHSVVKWSFEISGAGTESGCFLPSFHLLTALSCVIGWLTTNIAADAGRKESTGCAKCRLDAELPWQEKSSRSEKEWIPAQEATVYYHISYLLLPSCWHPDKSKLSGKTQKAL